MAEQLDVQRGLNPDLAATPAGLLEAKLCDTLFEQDRVVGIAPSLRQDAVQSAVPDRRVRADVAAHGMVVACIQGLTTVHTGLWTGRGRIADQTDTPGDRA
ncbi:unnamed protein product [Prorocentrum cordatum]|uniref:Uncharacterized protein n=1 Tax=Prorocentrum cordatum TaxID=2364126 RepID=A0ABN9Y684_9DINO|nr:unnamed protein product [Polarella glacialis]CAK0908095.1 unnamed protein product [Polarella glacialis]